MEPVRIQCLRVLTCRAARMAKVCQVRLRATLILCIGANFTFIDERLLAAQLVSFLRDKIFNA
jgi:hypothetical protein